MNAGGAVVIRFTSTVSVPRLLAGACSRTTYIHEAIRFHTGADYMVTLSNFTIRISNQEVLASRGRVVWSLSLIHI